MDQQKDCKKCSLSIDFKADSYTVCEGDCVGFFHASCVGVSEEALCFLSCNIIWMCDECMKNFRRWRDSNNCDPANATNGKNSLEDEVNHLKKTVAEIKQMVSNTVRATPAKNVPLLHSTPIPISSFELLDGTDASGLNAESDENQTTTTNDDRFSLFLTNIDESATERDIRSMVLRALDASEPERIDVVKLVSKWNQRRSRDYVSFKVALNIKWKPRALDPATWPTKLKFREFVNVMQNETWKPL